MNGVDVISSWNFWSHYFKQFPNAGPSKSLPGYSWPGNEEAFWKAVHNTGHNFCPSCHGKELLDLEDHPTIEGFSISRVYCLCALSRILDTDWRELESTYENKRLSEIKGWDNPPGAAKRTREIVEEAVHFIQYPGQWVYLHGGYGSGKTHIAYAVKTAMQGAALYLNMFDLNKLVHRALGNHTLDVLTDEISSAPVLILDDVGAEYPTPFFASTLYGILNERYARKQYAPTFITSNRTPFELLRAADQNYQRIGDRLRDEALVTLLTSKQESYRGKQT